MIVTIKCFSISLLLFLTLYSEAQSVNKDSIPFGKWKIIKYKLGRAPIGLDQNEINQFIGKFIRLSQKKVVFVNDTCAQPLFKMHFEGDSYFINNYQIQKSSLGVKQVKVWLLNLDCGIQPIYESSGSPNFSYEFILISRTSMIVNIMGVYFYLKKV